MLLNDIGKSPDTTFNKINRHLETNYGFKIAEDVSYQDLVAIMEQIDGEITELKVKGDDAKYSPEISKRLLILEGLKTLREFALVQFQSPDLDHVCDALSNFVHEAFRLGGTTHQDFEECVRDGMKQYRSSRYRFPDDMIEQRVRQAAMAKIHGPVHGPISGEMGVQSPEMECSMMEDELNELSKGTLGSYAKKAAGDAVVKGMQGRSAEDPAQRKAAIDKAGKRVHGVTKAVNKMVGEEADLEEKWAGDVEVKHTGRNTNKSVADLRSERAKAKERGDTKAVHQKDFAIRAKTGWGKAEEGKEEVEEAGPWGDVGKRASALGGHAPTVDSTKAKQQLARLGTGTRDLELKPEPELDKPSKDPFAAHRDALQKGVVHQPTARRTGMREHQNLVKRLRYLLETEVSEAEVMMAAKKFAQELQEMIEKIGRLQNEDLPPVTDKMRETYGTESSSAFQTQIYGALQGVMDALYTAKGQVDDAVSNMATTGQVGAETDMDKDIGLGGDEMGGDIDTGMDADLDLDNIGDELGAEGGDMGDEFGGAEEEEPLGRSMKTEALQQKVIQMKKLVEKAKKLKEAKKNA
jgi:uncharacterized protein (UPF0335 family)